MPRRSPTPCPEPGCPKLTSGGRCREHKPKDTRPTAAARGYDTAHRRRRSRYLTQHPHCQCHGCTACTPAGCARASTDLDHRDGNPRNNPPDGTNWAALCHPCHSTKTAAHDGSFGRPRTRRRPTRTRDVDPPPPAFA